MKSLDAKLTAIHADPGGSRDFILADAKDADMAFGLAATGTDPVTGRPRSLAEFRDQIREIVAQGLVDIMLMSPSTAEVLTIDQPIFDDSPVTPAVRANDTSDIHAMAGSASATEPSRPFRSATIPQLQTGRVDPDLSQPMRGPDLGLYSITPANQVEADIRSLEAYKSFRLEAELAGFRHFLEVFDPNVPATAPDDVGRYINDLVVRTLAGVPRTSRPLFLKMAYHGPRAMEELVAYDPHLVPGILGGSGGTTFDAFFLLEDARRHGARAALFGRKINGSEHQLEFVRHLRLIADGETSAEDACRSYHAALRRLGIPPRRSLENDLQLTPNATAYASRT
ncbi:MAG: hypothetical protein ACJ72A_07240 [Nocardioidaceae bacterium]